MITVSKKSITINSKKYKVQHGKILDVPSCLGRYHENHANCSAHLPGFDSAEAEGYIKRFRGEDGSWHWFVMNLRRN